MSCVPELFEAMQALMIVYQSLPEADPTTLCDADARRIIGELADHLNNARGARGSGMRASSAAGWGRNPSASRYSSSVSHAVQRRIPTLTGPATSPANRWLVSVNSTSTLRRSPGCSPRLTSPPRSSRLINAVTEGEDSCTPAAIRVTVLTRAGAVLAHAVGDHTVGDHSFIDRLRGPRARMAGSVWACNRARRAVNGHCVPAFHACTTATSRAWSGREGRAHSRGPGEGERSVKYFPPRYTEQATQVRFPGWGSGRVAWSVLSVPDPDPVVLLTARTGTRSELAVPIDSTTMDLAAAHAGLA